MALNGKLQEIIGKKIIVRQTRSSHGRGSNVQRTLQALGLGRIGKEREVTANPALLGMLNRVKHVVTVTDAS